MESKWLDRFQWIMTLNCTHQTHSHTISTSNCELTLVCYVQRAMLLAITSQTTITKTVFREATTNEFQVNVKYLFFHHRLVALVCQCSSLIERTGIKPARYKRRTHSPKASFWQTSAQNLLSSHCGEHPSSSRPPSSKRTRTNYDDIIRDDNPSVSYQWRKPIFLATCRCLFTLFAVHHSHFVYPPH